MIKRYSNPIAFPSFFPSTLFYGKFNSVTGTEIALNHPDKHAITSRMQSWIKYGKLSHYTNTCIKSPSRSDQRSEKWISKNPSLNSLSVKS